MNPDRCSCRNLHRIQIRTTCTEITQILAVSMHLALDDPTQRQALGNARMTVSL